MADGKVVIDTELNTKEAEKGITKLKKNIVSSAKVIAGATVAATTAFVGSSVKAGAEFDKAMSQVAATMGKTVDEIQNLNEFAQEMGRTTAFSATQAAEALNYMALAGYTDVEAMKMLPNVLNLAAAGNIDLARASDMVTDAQTAFGLKIEDMPQLIDEMAKAASTGNTSVAQLGEAFLTVGGLAKELNGGLITLNDGSTAEVDGIEELEIALTGMANAGIKGSEAGTHMRNMLLKLSSPTETGTKALENMGVTVFDTEGKMRSLSDIFSDLSSAMSTMTQEQKITTISDLFNTRDIAAAEALLATVEQDWNDIGASIIDSKDAASEMAKTQLDNLAGDVTLFKSALEGAQIAVSNKLAPSLRDLVSFGTTSLNKFTDLLKSDDIIGEIQNRIPTVIDTVKSILQNKLPTIFETVQPIIIEGTISAINFISEQIPTIIPKVMQIGSDILMWLIDGFFEAVPKFIDLLPTIVSSIAEGFIAAIPIMVDTGVKLLTSLVDNLPKIIDDIVAAIPEIINNLIDSLIKHGPDLARTGINLFVALISDIPKIIKTIVTAVPKIITAITTSIASRFPDLVKLGFDLFKQLLLRLPEINTKFVGAVGDILTSIISAFTAQIPAMIEVGKQLIEGVWNGIKNSATWLSDKIKDFAGDVVDNFTKFFGIQSPSKVMRDQVGRYIAQGIYVGFEDEDPLGQINKDIKYGMKNLDTSMTVNGGYYSGIDYDRLGKSTVQALIDSDFKIAVDGRDFGRVIGGYT